MRILIIFKMSLGVLKVVLVNVNLFQAKALEGERTVVELSVGNQTTTVTGNGKNFQSKEVALFGCHKSVLNIYAYSEGARDADLIVHGQVNLEPLFAIPKTRHVINVQTIYSQNGNIKDEPSGTIDVEIVYT